MLDLRPSGSRSDSHQHHCVVSLSKNINPSLVLVQPRKTCLFITERLLMGRKESNQTNKTFTQLFRNKITACLKQVTCLIQETGFYYTCICKMYMKTLPIVFASMMNVVWCAADVKSRQHFQDKNYWHDKGYHCSCKASSIEYSFICTKLNVLRPVQKFRNQSRIDEFVSV